MVSLSTNFSYLRSNAASTFADNAAVGDSIVPLSETVLALSPSLYLMPSDVAVIDRVVDDEAVSYPARCVFSWTVVLEVLRETVACVHHRWAKTLGGALYFMEL